MTKSTKEMLGNQGVIIARQVAMRRLRDSGLKLKGGVIKKTTVAQRDRLSPRLLKRLAGV